MKAQTLNETVNNVIAIIHQVVLRKVTLKPILIILLTSFLFSCIEKLKVQEFVPEKFEVETLTVRLNYAICDIITYKNGFLGRTSSFGNDDLQLIYLNKDFEVDVELSTRLNQGLQMHPEAIWTQGDTLYALCESRTYEVRYRLNDVWIISDSGTVNRENYRSSEKNLPLYEDEDFRVNSCCRGEFGGALFFYEKRTKKTFSCPSTCISSIQRFNESFYVSSSLSGYFSSVIKIEKPQELYEIQNEVQLNDCSWHDTYQGDNEDKVEHPKGYNKGYETIIDTFEITILGSFELKNHLYWIYSDAENTFIGYEKNKKLVAVDTLLTRPSRHSEVRDLKHNSSIIPIIDSQMNGVILIDGNKIRIVEFKQG